MAKSHFTSSIAYALFFCLLLIASNEMQATEAKLCAKMSQTWTGPCIITGNCNRQCRNWEKAQHGACHRRKLGFACFCYFKC